MKPETVEQERAREHLVAKEADPHTHNVEIGVRTT